MRRVGRLLGGLVALLGLAVVAIGVAAYAQSERRLARRHSLHAEALAIPTDSASVARGAHLATAIASCTLCHGADLGGATYGDAGPIGTFAGPNLTSGRGGIGAERTDLDLVRAIRKGVRRDGTSLIMMPSEAFTYMSGEDVAAIVAYVRHLPPVDRDVPRTRFGPLGRALLAVGKMELLVADKTPDVAPRAPVPAGPTASYGRYLADFSGCHGCHGFGLSGGRVAGPPDLPPASNLTPSGAIGRWSEASFVRVMREGRRPDGSAIDEFMPWKVFRGMTDDELRALWLYLRSVPPREFGHK
jgi:mono/diheme cytochrome c family protein